MARTIINLGIFVVATVVFVSADNTQAPRSTAPGAAAMRGMALVEADGYYGGWHGDEYGCCNHDCCCCCHHKVPEVTVHVIQPPPTYIYDVTQTACYTEHHDCCGCPYVCGPTCIPQGEVLAPCNAGKKVAIENKCHKNKHQIE
ncbi:hypothetical protein J3B02_003085 [Coemansia erecta]|uniref:Uncharacterized protein n=1 Tax=Coemansia asiatica TaxID=1052880 RepID=A0A9W8CJ19_9FUNG|nr:hypothetical protein LPJ64_004483 [Coemansia asiatica]KAJ2853562.1 hypothetical protein J3B02_003085 [Coemansia erecta]